MEYSLFALTVIIMMTTAIIIVIVEFFEDLTKSQALF